MENNRSLDLDSLKKDAFNFREVLNKFIYHWKWFLLSIIIAITFAFLYLFITPNQYKVSSAILITALDNEAGSSSESSAFGDLELFDGPKNSLDTEIGLLKAINLIKRVINELDLNITYYSKTNFVTKEIYQNEIPFNVNFFVNDSVLSQLSYAFSISAISTTEYTLFDSDGNVINEGSFGKKVPFEFGDILVIPSKINDIELGQKMFVNISPIEDVAIGLQERIQIAPETRKSNLLIISLQDPVKLKAQSILNNLVRYYNKDAVEYKNQITKNTDEFINKRIEDISIELTGFDRGVESYKKRNKLSDIDSEADIVLASNAGVGNQIVELTSQIKLIDYVSDYMEANMDDLIPGNLGLVNVNFSENITNYNQLLIERNNLLKSASKDNPIVTNLNEQLERLRESVDQSMLNTRLSLTFSLEEAKREEQKLASKIQASPKIEREIRDIQRQQEIVETLYLYLLQKKEENSISLAITSPNAKIIDKAYGSNIPVSPRKIFALVFALLLGILLPVSFIFIQSLLDNKIHILEDIEYATGAPIFGDIPSSKSKDKLISFEQNNNVTESFRLLRTNVDYMLRNHKGGKTIFITSTIAGEGKTFIALNLAVAFSLMNKKVLLIGADIRKPKVETYLKIKQEKGLTHFLIDNSLEFSEVIMEHEKTNLHIMAAGRIPINPSELLTNGRFEEIISYGKANYDYVIVDTAPVNLATDTLLLGHHADLFVYVVRANFLNKRMLNIPRNLHDKKRLPNIAMLLNDTNYEKRGYDSSYSYGGDEANISWFKKLFK